MCFHFSPLYIHISHRYQRESIDFNCTFYIHFRTTVHGIIEIRLTLTYTYILSYTSIGNLIDFINTRSINFFSIIYVLLQYANIVEDIRSLDEGRRFKIKISIIRYLLINENVFNYEYLLPILRQYLYIDTLLWSKIINISI